MIAFPSFALLKQRDSKSLRLLTAGGLAGLLLFVLTGTNPEADVIAHLGGFIVGFLLGALLSFTPRLTRSPRVNLVAGILFVVLVILPWFLALNPR
jgi:membrane associated rhomboid family serine protease